MNIQYETLKALSTVELPKGIKSIILSAYSSNLEYESKRLSKINQDYIKEFGMTAESDIRYNMSNGLILDFSGKKDFYIITDEAKIIDFSKWATSNIFGLNHLFSFEDSPARDIDKEMFKIVLDIYKKLDKIRKEAFAFVKENKINLFTGAVSGKPSMVIAKDETYHHGASLYGLRFRRIINLDSMVGEAVYNGYYGQYFMDYDGDFDSFSKKVFEEDFNNAYNSPALLSRLLTSSFVDVNIEKYIDNKDEPRIYFLNSGYITTEDGISVAFLRDNGIEYKTCDITGNLVLAKNDNLTLDYDKMSTMYLNNDAGLVISRNYIEDNVVYRECEVCGDSHAFPSPEFLETAKDKLTEEKFEVFKTFLEREYGYYYDEQEEYDDVYYDYVCSDCKQRERRLSESLEKLNCTLKDNKFTDAHGNVSYISSRGIEEYDFAPDFEFYKDYDDEDNPLYMGVELEIDNGGEDDAKASLITSIIDSDFVYAMHDGSLDNGFEIATMPATLKYHQSVGYEPGFEIAKALGYRSHDTDSCGLHVHMNRRFFGASRSVQSIKAAFMALILEKNWDEIVRFSRRNYHSIQEWADKMDLIDDIEEDDTNDDIEDKFADKYSHDKYVALNTNHSNTFELRIFKGTLKYNTYIATLQFVSNLAHVAKECNSLSKVQQITFKDIVEYKEYGELSRYLKERSMTQTD